MEGELSLMCPPPPLISSLPGLSPTGLGSLLHELSRGTHKPVPPSPGPSRPYAKSFLSSQTPSASSLANRRAHGSLGATCKLVRHADSSSTDLYFSKSPRELVCTYSLRDAAVNSHACCRFRTALPWSSPIQKLASPAVPREWPSYFCPFGFGIGSSPHTFSPSCSWPLSALPVLKTRFSRVSHGGTCNWN